MVVSGVAVEVRAMGVSGGSGEGDEGEWWWWR